MMPLPWQAPRSPRDSAHRRVPFFFVGMWGCYSLAEAFFVVPGRCTCKCRQLVSSDTARGFPLWPSHLLLRAAEGCCQRDATCKCDPSCLLSAPPLPRAATRAASRDGSTLVTQCAACRHARTPSRDMLMAAAARSFAGQKGAWQLPIHLIQPCLEHSHQLPLYLNPGLLVGF